MKQSGICSPSLHTRAVWGKVLLWRGCVLSCLLETFSAADTLDFSIFFLATVVASNFLIATFVL